MVLRGSTEMEPLGPAEAVGGWASEAEMLGYCVHMEFTARGVPDLSANVFFSM